MDFLQGICSIEPSGNKDRIWDAIKILTFCLIVGLAIIVLFAFKSVSFSEGISIAGVGLLLAGGIFFLGGLLGFLFGIPKKFQESGPANDTLPGASESQKALQPFGRYQANTNLEQISDWLTKILVGVGLTQLTQIPSGLRYFAENISPALGGFPSGGAFSIALLIFFSVDGFLIGYLWTRRYFACELQQSDIELQKIDEMSKFKTDREKQAEDDAKALNLAERVLNPPPNEPPVTQQDLNTKIAVASPSIRANIYYKAENIRIRNWEDKPVLERTEKIFRALIASDTENRYCNNHGGLAYVLWQKRIPDFKEAEAEFTKAIEIRGPHQEYDNVWYEFYRARSKINLDQEFKKGMPSTESVKKSIFDDLDAAAIQEDVKKEILRDQSVSEWRKLNNHHFK